MSEQDRLAEIKARRAAITPGRWSAMPATFDKDPIWNARATFIHHAPADIDWLVKQAELAFELGDLLPQKILTIDRLRGEVERLQREVNHLDRLRWSEHGGELSEESWVPPYPESTERPAHPEG